MIDIQQIDEVIERTGESYEVVREALFAAEGNVDEAVKAIQEKQAYEAQAQAKAEEEAKEGPKKTSFQAQSGAVASDIIETIREIWEKGNASSLVIEKDGETVLKLSLTVGTIGLVIAPVAALIGLGAALITEYTIKVILDDGEVIDVNELALTRKSSREKKAPSEDSDIIDEEE